MTDLTEIDGTTPLRFCQMLSELAHDVPANQAIIELGVYKGRTLCWLAHGAAKGRGARVYGVDVWDSSSGIKGSHVVSMHFASEALVANGLQATLIRSLTADAARDYDGPSVGLLYIDAGHAENAVMSDVDAWMPHLHRDGLIVFDDCHARHPGVVSAVRKLRKRFVTWSFDSRFAYARGPLF